MVAWLGLIAIVAAILAIVWLRVVFVGTKDVQRALALEEAQGSGASTVRAAKPHSLRRKAEDAAAQSRWATGFSH